MSDSTIVELQLSDHAQMNEVIRRDVASTFGRSELVEPVTRHALAEEEVSFPAARELLRAHAWRAAVSTSRAARARVGRDTDASVCCSMALFARE